MYELGNDSVLINRSNIISADMLKILAVQTIEHIAIVHFLDNNELVLNDKIMIGNDDIE